jgi:hypothetical protein
MYAFSRDEHLLLFMDGFGLTRMTQPSEAKRAKGVWQLKTDATIMGSESAGRVSVSASGELAATYEDLWDKSVIWSLPELRPSKRFDRFREKGVVVHPEGTHHIVLEGGQLRLEPLVRAVLLPRRLDRPAPKARSNTTLLSLEGGASLEPWQLGEASTYVPIPLRIGHDGTVIVHAEGELIRGKLAGDTLDIEWRRALRVPEQVRVDIHADAARTIVMVQEGPRWRIAERKGSDEREHVIECLGVPVVAGPYLAWQASASEVVRMDLDAGRREHFSLAGNDVARTSELPCEGIGTLFAGARGSLLVLLHHRESLVDLVHRVEIARKLPAKQLELRKAVLARARPYLDAALAAGITLELGRIELDDKHQSVSITHRIAGPSSSFGAALVACSRAAWHDATFPGGWRMSSYGSHGGISCEDPIDLPALVHTCDALARAGLGFASTLEFWADQFEGDTPLDPALLAWLARALMALATQGRAATIDGVALAELPAPSLDEARAALEHYPAHADELDRHTSALLGRVFNALFGAAAAPLWVHLYLDATWPSFGTAYYELGSGAIEPLLDAHPETGDLFRAWITSHRPLSDDRRWYVEQLEQRLAR